MLSNQKASIAFALALLLLCVSALTAGLVIVRLDASETQIRHTYDVQVAIGDLERSLTEVGRSRVAYIDSASPEALKTFGDAVQKVGPAVAKIRRLVSDNPAQRTLCDRLESISNERVAVSQRSVEYTLQGGSDPKAQAKFTTDAARTAFETAAITQEMEQNEDRLLARRNRISNLLFTIILGVITVSTLFSASMFWLHYRLLNREIDERQAGEDRLRHLSVRIMQVQDEAHRRFARELHDGLGQNLIAAKIMAEKGNSGKLQSLELAALIGDALAQTRTISYLFHPPLLDDVGFASAARWLIEGYTRRTGVMVSADIQEPQSRLPQAVELTLYRVLQEALNNVHNHSRSVKAEVSFEVETQRVILRIKDYGRGIPSEILEAFHADGTSAGVGLLSMKERVREQRGNLEVRSRAAETEIVVQMPLDGHVAAENS